MARLHADAQRADGAGDEDFASGGLAGFAGDFHPAAVEALDFLGEAERLELEAIRAKRVGLDDLRARFDVSLVDAEYRFRLGRIHLIEAALRAHGIVEHRAHRAIGDKDGVFQPLVEIKNLHSSCFLSAENFAREMRSAFLFHEAGDGAHQIVLGEDFEVSVAHLDKNRGILVTEDVSDALDGRGPGHLWQRFAHHFANDELTKILALQREVEYLVFVDRADRNIFLKYRNLRNVLLLHGLQGVENSLVGPRDDEFAHLAGGVFGVDNFRSGDGGSRVNVAALVHPQVIINLAEVARAGVRQQRDHEIIRSQILGEAQRAGNAAAAGPAGEEAFQLRQSARNDETFFVVHLKDIVQDFQIHGRREEILADAFHNVGLGFDGLPGFDEIVVERAKGIYPDDFDAGIFFLQVFSHAADGAAGAYAANEMRDLALAVFPNLGTRDLGRQPRQDHAFRLRHRHRRHHQRRGKIPEGKKSQRQNHRGRSLWLALLRFRQNRANHQSQDLRCGRHRGGFLPDDHESENPGRYPSGERRRMFRRGAPTGEAGRPLHRRVRRRLHFRHVAPRQ